MLAWKNIVLQKLTIVKVYLELLPVCLDHIPESSASFFVQSLAASSTFTHL